MMMEQPTLNLHFCVYLGFLDLDVVASCGQEHLFKEAKALGAVIHPNALDTFLKPHKLSERLIKAIIAQTIAGVAVQDYEEELTPIAGGLILQYGNHTIEPQCCVDAMEFEQWAEVLAAPSTTWKDIWIGHPWVYYKVAGNVIHFSDYNENSDVLELSPKISIPFLQFSAALQEALTHLEAFRAKVAQFIDQGAYQKKAVLKERLVKF